MYLLTPPDKQDQKQWEPCLLQHQVILSFARLSFSTVLMFVLPEILQFQTDTSKIFATPSNANILLGFLSDFLSVGFIYFQWYLFMCLSNHFFICLPMISPNCRVSMYLYPVSSDIKFHINFIIKVIVCRDMQRVLVAVAHIFILYYFIIQCIAIFSCRCNSILYRNIRLHASFVSHFLVRNTNQVVTFINVGFI